MRVDVARRREEIRSKEKGQEGRAKMRWGEEDGEGGGRDPLHAGARSTAGGKWLKRSLRGYQRIHGTGQARGMGTYVLLRVGAFQPTLWSKL